jgi:transcriptional regulator with XRE-family HTH domain
MAGKIAFGEVLKRLRKERNLTQEKLAEEIGLKKSVVSGYEANTGFPSFEGLVKLATFFDVGLDQLVYGQGVDAIVYKKDDEGNQTVYAIQTKKYTQQSDDLKDQMLAKLINEMEYKSKQLQKCEEEVERLKNGRTPVYGK